MRWVVRRGRMMVWVRGERGAGRGDERLEGGVDDHFRDVTKIVDLGTEPSREIDDVALSKSPLRGR